MLKKVYKPFRNLLLMVSIFAMTITFANCKAIEPVVYSADENRDINEYKTFTAPEEEDIRFSFEYPEYYWINPQGGVFGFEITTGGSTLEELHQGKKNIIDIGIPCAKGTENADIAMKENISGIKWEFLRNFRLIQKHRVMVNGYEGWETVITFRERVYPARIEGPSLPPAFIVQRDIFLDYQGVTYRIEIYADEQSYEQNKGDFEHILKTFKVIE
jgi:hypothetical protein